MMEEPPFMLDGARVVRYAVLDRAVTHGAPISIVVDGVSLDTHTVAGLAVAENLVDGSAYLLHCNSDWQTVGAAQHPGVQAAEQAAGTQFAGIPLAWRAFRELTEAERREVETTRSFLREIAAEDPHG